MSKQIKEMFTLLMIGVEVTKASGKPSHFFERGPVELGSNPRIGKIFSSEKNLTSLQSKYVNIHHSSCDGFSIGYYLASGSW